MLRELPNPDSRARADVWGCVGGQAPLDGAFRAGDAGPGERMVGEKEVERRPAGGGERVRCVSGEVSW